MSGVLAGAAITGWTLVVLLALKVWQLDAKLAEMEHQRPVKAFTDEPVVEADGLPIYRVTQTTSDGRRARIMFERGTPGPREHLTLYDGSQIRGHKHGETS